MHCVVCCLQVWDPEAKADTSVQHNQHRHKLTPYGALPLKGKVLATYVSGHKVSEQALFLWVDAHLFGVATFIGT